MSKAIAGFLKRGIFQKITENFKIVCLAKGRVVKNLCATCTSQPRGHLSFLSFANSLITVNSLLKKTICKKIPDIFKISGIIHSIHHIDLFLILALIKLKIPLIYLIPKLQNM